MLGIILATHGKLGAELLATAQGIVGPIEATRALTIDPNQQTEQIREVLVAAINELDQGDGVLILTDMFGGTPANIGLSFLDERKVEVVTGVNLPMVLKIGSARGTSAGLPLREVAEMITAYGQKNIVFASALLHKAHAEETPT